MRIGRLYRRSLLLAAAAAVGLVLLLYGLEALQGLELSSVDWRFSIRGTLGRATNIALVGIDETTFSHVNHRFPFPRRFDARVINRLAHDGARVIAYDAQFTEPTETADDNALILATRRAGNVVLATTEVAKGGSTRIFGGGQGLAFSRATPGEAQFPVDSDGRIRRMRPQVLGLQTFALAVAERAQHRHIAVPGGGGASNYIAFRGPAGTFPLIPYWRVLQGQLPAAAVRGKIVVVGATEAILHDVHATATDNQMSGAEVQANAIDTALRGFPLRRVPGWLNVALIVIMGLVAPLTALRAHAGIAAAAALGAELVLAAGCQLAFGAGWIVAFIYPTMAALLGTAAALALQTLRSVFERERVRDIFARFVPESVVTEVLARAGGARLGGVRGEATVMFSDLRGFTSFAEAREPSETIEVLNRYLTRMSDAILAHGGTIVTYMGDGIMAVFGAPVAQPDHADRALGAARAMLAALEHFNRELGAADGGPGFKMGIGLNTGPVMSGNVGSERRLEYTVIGDTTNTASRLEAMTKDTPHQLYVSGSTQEALHGDPDGLVALGEFEIRGRAQPLSVWTLAEVQPG